MKFEKIAYQYKEACKESVKNELYHMINDFVEDDTIDDDYKEKIINIIAELLVLKRKKSL